MKNERFLLGEIVIYGGVECEVVNYQAVKGKVGADGRRIIDYVIKSPGGKYYTISGKHLIPKENS